MAKGRLGDNRACSDNYSFGGIVVYLYSLTLLISSTAFGTFCRTVMQDLGLVPNLGSGLVLMMAAGCLYVFLQSAFMSILRLYQPSQAPSIYITEIISNAAIVALIPYILHISIPWPSALFVRVEPLILLGVFGVIHLFCKLATFYAAHQGELSQRRIALNYMILSVVMLLGVIIFQGRWTASLEAARIQAPDETQSLAVNSMIANARIVPEGAVFTSETTSDSNQTISARFANVDSGQLSTIYATFGMKGKTNTLYETSVKLPVDGWGEVRVPNEFLPDDLREAEVRWTRKQEPNWQRIFGLRPIVFAPEDEFTAKPYEVSISGPFFNFERPVVGKPNIIVIMIDGLAANHLSMLGYPREVTPSLDKLGYTGLVFPNTMIDQASINDSLWQLFTGKRIALSTSNSFIDTLHDAGYATIAYTEGDGNGDLTYTSREASGFELFSAGYSTVNGSKQTLSDARQWISQHQQIPFFMMLRLRSLENAPTTMEEGKSVYPQKGAKRPIDRFDNALLDLDQKIGSLLKYVRDREIRKNTFILVTAPYGHEFSLKSSGQLLKEPSKRVPLIVNGPGLRTGQVPRQVSMADIGMTISDITNISYPELVDGQSVR